MREFKLLIVSPDKTLYDGSAVYCCLTTTEGQIGVKAYHEPFMAVIKDGTTFLYRTPEGEDHEFTVHSGLFSFRKNRGVVTVRKGDN